MRYTDEELMLCVYAALYDDADIGRWSIICQVYNRSLVSVKFKIWNVRKTIDAFIRMVPDVWTNKPVDPMRIVEYVEMPRSELREQCIHFLRSEGLL